jgi:hypothetical protein
MQYMLLCCFNESHWEAIPQAERDGLMRDYGEWVQRTQRSGHYVTGGKLRGTASATTVREKNGKSAITDGPFAETKEHLGGFHVIECRDLDEALSIARAIPTLRHGGAIEVRPLDPQYAQPLPATTPIASAAII